MQKPIKYSSFSRLLAMIDFMCNSQMFRMTSFYLSNYFVRQIFKYLSLKYSVKCISSFGVIRNSVRTNTYFNCWANVVRYSVPILSWIYWQSWQFSYLSKRLSPRLVSWTWFVFLHVNSFLLKLVLRVNCHVLIVHLIKKWFKFYII